MANIARRANGKLGLSAEQSRKYGKKIDKCIESAEEVYQEGLQSALEYAIEAGEILTEVKDKLKHGEWLPWLADYTSISERTAQRYIQVYRNAPRVADLPSINQAVAEIAEHSEEPDEPEPEDDEEDEDEEPEDDGDDNFYDRREDAALSWGFSKTTGLSFVENPSRSLRHNLERALKWNKRSVIKRGREIVEQATLQLDLMEDGDKRKRRKQ
jgi:DUF3102 family protein